MLRNKRLFLAVSVLMIAAMIISGCGPKGTAPGAEVSLNLTTEPPTTDPALATDNVSIEVCESLFLGLTDFDDETYEVRPELATEWKASDDGLTWTFTMRKDAVWVRYDPQTAKFENKRPVTAHDVEYAVKRTLNPETASDYAYILYAVKNSMAYNTGEITDPAEVGVRAVDDYTVEFTLEYPAGYFPAIAGLWIARPVPQEVIDEFGGDWTEPGNVWTNGAYGFAQWEHESKIELVLNPHYYDAKNVSISKVHYAIINEESTAFAMYENGELDSASVPSADIDRVKADPVLSKEYIVSPDLYTGYYGFNVTKPPVDNKLVRQALSYAVDRQKLCDTVIKGGRVPAKTFAPPGIFGSPAEDPNYQGISFDPEKAQALLAEAGYPNGEGFPETTLMYNTAESNQSIAEFIQQNWKDVLNIDVTLANQEWKVYLDTLTEDAPQIFRLAWGADYPDENNWVMENFHSTKGSNDIRWSNPEFDQACDEAAQSADPSVRTELYAKAEKILCVDEAAIIPIFHNVQVHCTKPYLHRAYAVLGGNHVDRWTVDAH